MLCRRKSIPAKAEGRGRQAAPGTQTLSLEAGVAKPLLSKALRFLPGPLEPEISQLT